MNTEDSLHEIRFCPVCGRDSFRPEMEEIDNGGYLFPHSYTCSNCGFTFFINGAASTMALIHDEQGRILFLRRNREPKKGTLDLPGGFLNPGERAEHGIAREVFEETNLTIESYELFQKTYCNTYEYGGVRYQTLDLVFICSVESWDDLKANDPDEGEPVLLDSDMIDPEQIGLDSVRRFFLDYLFAR
jgi:ADP-ribose pyrophosphatase YjhB (NUDIX family)/rubredoxin